MLYTCLIGDPVEHSKSPKLYGYFAARADLEYSHIKIRVPKKESKALRSALRSIKELGFRGINVTLPYKQGVIPLLDSVSREGKKIGAINTIVIKNGVMHGVNTDGAGALRAIQDKRGRIISGDQALIIGAGGAARAIAWEMLKKTSHVTIVNREQDFNLATSLKKDFSRAGKLIKIELMDNRSLTQFIKEADIVVNATSVGMVPNAQKSPVNEQVWDAVKTKCSISQKTFFDVVFNPIETLFLKTAKRLGGQSVSGIDMMVYQGAAAFKLWTGHIPNGQDVKFAIKLMTGHAHES